MPLSTLVFKHQTPKIPVHCSVYTPPTRLCPPSSSSRAQGHSSQGRSGARGLRAAVRCSHRPFVPARKQVSDQQKSIKGWWAFHKQLAAGHWLHCSDSLDPLCVAGVPWQIPARLMIFSKHFFFFFFFFFFTAPTLLLIRLRHRALCLLTHNYSRSWRVCAFLSFPIAFFLAACSNLCQISTSIRVN